MRLGTGALGGTFSRDSSICRASLGFGAVYLLLVEGKAGGRGPRLSPLETWACLPALLLTSCRMGGRNLVSQSLSFFFCEMSIIIVGSDSCEII